MSVVKADVKADGRNIRESFTGSYVRVVTWDSQGRPIVNWYPLTNISGSVTYAAFSDDPADSSMNVMQSARLPALGAYYCDERGTTWAGVTYSDRSARYIGPRGNYFMWEVSYTLSGSPKRESSGEEEEEDTVILNFDASVETYDEADGVDLDNKYNVNSLGFFFEDPLIFKKGILNLNYQRREYSNPLSTILNYLGCINGSGLWGFPIGTVRLSDMSYSSTVTESETTYDVTYRLQYKTAGWNIVKANSSYYYTYNGQMYRALNNDGSPKETPVLIAVDGSLLADGVAPPTRSFRIYNYADLNDLNLPSPFDL